MEVWKRSGQLALIAYAKLVGMVTCHNAITTRVVGFSAMLVAVLLFS
jgi:hypothetical protein